ncbi:unnamed protein product [Ectocarpus sp. 6 AP-2014]
MRIGKHTKGGNLLTFFQKTNWSPCSMVGVAAGAAAAGAEERAGDKPGAAQRLSAAAAPAEDVETAGVGSGPTEAGMAGDPGGEERMRQGGSFTR